MSVERLRDMFCYKFANFKVTFPGSCFDAVLAIHLTSDNEVPRLVQITREKNLRHFPHESATRCIYEAPCELILTPTFVQSVEPQNTKNTA